MRVAIIQFPGSNCDQDCLAALRDGVQIPAGYVWHKEESLAGYDAVVPLGMLDLGVEGGRSAVDIPVIAPLQAVLHVAAQVGEHFGVVCYHPSAFARHRAQCIAYGMEGFIAGRRAETADESSQSAPTPA